jgi:hypothetical protein
MSRAFQSVIGLILVLQVGCITGGSKFEEVEFDRSQSSMVYFYRPSQFIAAWPVAEISVDGVTVGKLKNGTSVWATMAPGEHRLAVRGVDGSTGLESGPLGAPKRGGVIYIRIRPIVLTQTTGTWAIDNVPAEEARREIRSTRTTAGRQIP